MVVRSLALGRFGSIRRMLSDGPGGRFQTSPGQRFMCFIARGSNKGCGMMKRNSDDSLKSGTEKTAPSGVLTLGESHGSLSSLRPSQRVYRRIEVYGGAEFP